MRFLQRWHVLVGVAVLFGLVSPLAFRPSVAAQDLVTFSRNRAMVVGMAQADQVDQPDQPDQADQSGSQGNKANRGNQTAPVDQSPPADQTAPVDQSVPADQTAPVDQAAPVDQSGQNLQVDQVMAPGGGDGQVGLPSAGTGSVATSNGGAATFLALAAVIVTLLGLGHALRRRRLT